MIAFYRNIKILITDFEKLFIANAMESVSEKKKARRL